MKVAFIIPKQDDQHDPQNQSCQDKVFPPVGLARMAGITGKCAHINIVDERLESDCSPQHAHIAVIFINSYNQQRACKLAHLYKSMNCCVVLTGPMLSHSIDRDYKTADCLFIGAGEDNLHEFLSDYQKGKIRRIYRSNSKKASVTAEHHKTDNVALQLAS